MIDPATETIITPLKASHMPELTVDEKPCHIETIRNYFKRGVRGADKQRHKLDAIKMPCGWCTSVEAVKRFVAAINAVEKPKATVNRGRAAAATAQLAKLGI